MTVLRRFNRDIGHGSIYRSFLLGIQQTRVDFLSYEATLVSSIQLKMSFSL
jgi:hypothetical protein